MSLRLNGSTSGYSEIEAPAVAGDQTFTLPGTGGTIVTADGTQTLTNKTVQGGAITAGTAVASTSGTAIDFTGIPSWVKKITVMFDGVSLSGSSSYLIQLGDSGGIETTGYSGGSARYGLTSIAAASYTNGLAANNVTASATYSGHIIWTNITGNTWAGSLNLGASGGTESGCMGGSSKTLSDTLTQVRITTVNGTDTFDAGSINILMEG